MADTLKISLLIQPTMDAIAKKYNLTDTEIKQIASGGINRSLTTVQSRMVKLLASQINLRQSDIRKSVMIRKANYSRLTGSVELNRKIVPLIDFIGTRQTKEGVSVLVRKNGPRELIKSAFIATMPKANEDQDHGHTGVFIRTRHLPTKGPNVGNPRYKLTPSGVAGRLSIRERFGLTLTGYLSHAQSELEKLQADAGDVLQKNIMSQLQRRLAERVAK